MIKIVPHGYACLNKNCNFLFKNCQITLLYIIDEDTYECDCNCSITLEEVALLFLSFNFKLMTGANLKYYIIL